MKRKGIWFVLPSLIGVMIFYIVPFGSSIKYCFTSGVTERVFVGFTNFKYLLSDPVYQLAIKNTLKIIGTSLPILIIGSVIAAIVLEKKLKKFYWLQSILMMPMVIPAACTMLVWMDLLGMKGLLNTLLQTQIDWLDSGISPFVISGIVIWKNIGYNVILIISVLINMPKEYEEAASLDGAGFWKTAWYIKVPYLVPMLFFTAVISLMNCFKIFREVYLLQGDYPSINLYMLQHFMNQHFAQLNYEILASASFLLYIVIFIIVLGMAYAQSRYTRNN